MSGAADEIAALAASLARGGPPQRWLRLARLRARGGDADGAIADLERALGHHPDHPALTIELLYREGVRAQAARMPYARRLALGERVMAMPRAGLSATDLLRGAAALINLPDQPGARAWLRDAVAALASAKDIAVAARLVPVVFERPQRALLRAAMLERLRALPDRAANARLELALLFALRERDDYLALFDVTGGMGARDPLAIVARRWRTPIADVLAEPRVIGIGLPKTATTSLAAALRALGYFHADHHCPVAQDYVTIEDAPFYDSITDCAAAQDFETAYHLFPNARFVVTERPCDGWLASVDRHFRRTQGAGDWAALRDGPGASALTLRNGRAQLLTHFATLLNAPDAAAAHARHGARVAHFFAGKPAEKLLRLDVFAGHGWPELGAFLGRPVPVGPFPRENVAR